MAGACYHSPTLTYCSGYFRFCFQRRRGVENTRLDFFDVRRMIGESLDARDAHLDSQSSHLNAQSTHLDALRAYLDARRAHLDARSARCELRMTLICVQCVAACFDSVSWTARELGLGH